MAFLILSFLASLLTTLVVIRSAAGHASFSADHDLSGPQKFHSSPVPRIGGVGVFVALLAGASLAQWLGHEEAGSIWLLLLCGLPTFAAGMAEDLTKSVSPAWRLAFTALSALMAAWLLESVITRTDIPGLDLIISVGSLAVIATVFAVTGVANSVNIIDGFNGLASMCVLLMVLAVAYVAFQVGDQLVLTSALIISGAVLGFFVWNFPAGLIFLGDGGAYLLGFLLAELCVLLLHANSAVSPIFPLLLCAYPIFETLFTMYRRKFVRGVATAAPDGIHLHTLIHRRLVRWTVRTDQERSQTARNSMTSPYLWVLCLLSVIPSVLWWYSTPILSGFLATFVVSYVLLYRSIVLFKTPRWLTFRR